MERFDKDLQTVVDYFLCQISGGDDRPLEVVIALCQLCWPDRSFCLASEAEAETPDYGLVLLSHVRDEQTGETAAELYSEMFSK